MTCRRVVPKVNEERVAHARHAKEKVARRRQCALMRSHRAERERFFHVFEIWRDQNGQFVVLHGIMFFSGGRDHITIPDWSPHPPGLHVIRKMVGHAGFGFWCTRNTGRPRFRDYGNNLINSTEMVKIMGLSGSAVIRMVMVKFW